MSCCDELKAVLDDILTIMNQLRPDIQAMISNSQQETYKTLQELHKLQTEQRQADLLALIKALKKGGDNNDQAIIDEIVKSKMDLWNGMRGK
jgi:hypothetical protein